jgi:hypothetical protein
METIAMRVFLALVPTLLFVCEPALSCGSNGPATMKPPPPGQTVDRHLSVARLTASEFKRVGALRAEIVVLVSAGQIEQARAVEEEAMGALGFKKIWLRCGRGTFMWRNDRPSG